MDCKSCGAHIPSWAKVDGRLVNLGSRRYCLTCSPHGERAKNRKTGDTKRCPKCQEDLPAGAFYMRRKKVGIGNLHPWCRECSRKESVARQRAFKEKCVEYKGGACSRCGYSKYVGALEFHHRDPTQKDFSVSKVRSHVWSDEIRRELDKCDLVCANCHREIHGDV